MTDQQELLVVKIGIGPFQFSNHEQDVLHALLPTGHPGLVWLPCGWQRLVSRDLMLDADDIVATLEQVVRDEGIGGVFSAVAVAENGGLAMKACPALIDSDGDSAIAGL